MSRQSLERFKRLALRTASVQEALKAATNEQEFIELVVQLGQEKGYEFTAEELAESIQEQNQELNNMTFGERAIRDLRGKFPRDATAFWWLPIDPL
jgi:hypothetical protein